MVIRHEVQVGPGIVRTEVQVSPGIIRSEVAKVVGPQGPQGAPGAPGDSSSTEIEITIPTATWVIAVPPGIGRTPGVAVYIGGELVYAEVHASETQVSIIFPGPMTGTVVLT